MSTGYWTAIDYAAELAPTLDKPTEFIKWAEDITALISHIYGKNYDDVTVALYDATKEAQDWEDEDS
jgi:phenylpyruvate tautomerase PptA (4-oxalocrotonate tautomerase family)